MSPPVIVPPSVNDSTSNLADDIRRTIVETVGKGFKVEDIGLDQPLYGPGSLGLHSLDIFELTLELETRLGIEIDDADIPKLNSVAAIVALVESRRRV